MNSQGILYRALPTWQVWGAAISGSIFTALIAGFAGIGENQLLIEPGQKEGFALGVGVVVGLAIWALFYAVVLRHASKRARWLCYIAMAASGMVASYMSLA